MTHKNVEKYLLFKEDQLILYRNIIEKTPVPKTKFEQLIKTANEMNLDLTAKTLKRYMDRFAREEK